LQNCCTFAAMHYLGELISIGVAVSWTITAILSEYASKQLGSITLNMLRMIFTLAFSIILFVIVLGNPLPATGSTKAYLWMTLSGFVGFVMCDYCLMKCYMIIGSRFGQLFMTLSPLSAAFTAWILLDQEMKPMSILAMFITLTGIFISILGRSDKHLLSIKLPLNGIFYAATAAVCQGIGLVISKVGLNYYETSMPTEVLAHTPWILPFCANFFRCIAGLAGFSILMVFNRSFGRLLESFQHAKVQSAVVATTIFGPFVGVAFSLMAVQYAPAGIASTLMALTPIIILLPAHFFFHQKITKKGIIGACISVLGVALFFN
jgi:drug/metabolite transporter (DMT)-like permease